MEDVDKLIAGAIGKYANELDIPVSDVEEKYYEDFDEYVYEDAD